MGDDPQSQIIRAWSKDKLQLLGKYIAAYSTIMAKQREPKGWLKSYAYIDAFANVGQYVDKESAELVNGSPLVSLGVEPRFDEYVFIEQSPARIVQLERRLQAHPLYSRCRFVPGDSNEVLLQQVCQTYRYERFTRALAFLDPYGFEVSWSTVEALAETKAIDIFVNFPIMAINRILDRNREPDPGRLALIRQIMGRDDWARNAYQGRMDLFGDIHYSRGRFEASQVVGAYIDQVRQVFRYVSDAVVMRNSTNSPLYALFLASHRDIAVDITNQVVRRYQLERLQ